MGDFLSIETKLCSGIAEGSLNSAESLALFLMGRAKYIFEAVDDSC